MSAHWYTEPDPGRGRNLSRLAKAAAAVVAVAALALGAKAIAGGGSSSASATGVPGGSSLPDRQAGGLGGVGGPIHPRGMGDTRQGGPGGPPPGFGSDVTPTTLDRLKSAVAKRYPGSVERAVKLPDGSYVVHVIRSDGGEVHVHVSKDFKVIGADRRDFHGGAPPAGEGAPSDDRES